MRLKKGKVLAHKVRASESLTAVAAQVRNSKAVFGKSRPVSLSGAGTLRIRLGKALKKGSYTVDLAGTDSQGVRRFAAARLTVR
jgi:hypothetical protein